MPRHAPGSAAEQALCQFLGILGIKHTPQYAWGAELTPPRRYRADVRLDGLPVLVEVVGGAHIAGRDKLARDIERSRLAAQAGWIVLPYTPEDARNGTATLDIDAYLTRQGWKQGVHYQRKEA